MLVQVWKLQVPSGELDQVPSKVQRSKNLSNICAKLSAGDTVSQFSHKLHTCDLEDRKQVLQELGGAFEVYIPSESVIAFKRLISTSI